MLWGIKGLHRAIQPKYDGKTAAEWYASTSVQEVGFVSSGEAANLPVIIAFKNMGPEGCRFLWAEHTRRSSSVSQWVGDLKARVTGEFDPFEVTQARSIKAYFILLRLGPDAEPILPELLEELKKGEPFRFSAVADLIAEIRLQPEKVIPALLNSLVLPNLTPQDQTACIRALEMYGPVARPYLPQLKTALSNQTNDVGLRLSLAIATTRISEDSSYLKNALAGILSANPIDLNDLKAVAAILEQFGPDGSAAAAVLREQNHGWNYARFTPKQIAEVIRALDPL